MAIVLRQETYQYIIVYAKWKVPIDDSDGEKFTCQLVRKQRAKRNTERLLNHHKKAAKKERIKNTPFTEDADDPFVPFIIKTVTSNEIVSNEEEFFPTNPHPFRTGTIIEEN
jgi:hypothetical protein